MSDFLTATAALTDSILVRWLLLLAVICAALTLAMRALYRLDRALEERRRVRDLNKYRAAVAAHEMTWTDEALGRVLAALDETDALTNGEMR